eukprot:GFKZ01013883.1.p1 GENE.GFKZ01013883.1~~GFKZ01013883.1.p1  ORF type:complete len:660 (+),score=136.52 GFKZ01013883.1:60-2039(+)
MRSPSATVQDELDAEILAVTEGQKRGGRSRDDLSDASASSDGQYDGVSDIDAPDDDNDQVLIDDDDDDEDDEFVLEDEDDDNYTSKKKSRTREKKSSSSRKPAKSRPKQRSKSQPKPETASISDEEEEFVYKYDKDGYGDDDDREALARMNEFEREKLLADRLEERTKQMDLWNMKREMMAREGPSSSTGAERKSRSSGRNKASSKSDALQALAEDKRKKSSRAFVELSDADSETDSRPKRDREERARAQKEPEQPEVDLMSAHEGPELRYSDLVKVEKAQTRATHLFLPRDTIMELSQKPYFIRVVLGLYARIKVAGGADDGSYLLCRIVDVEKGMTYSLTSHLKTNYWLVLQIGKGRRRFQILQTSASPPLESEFEIYRNRTLERGYELPRREEVEKLMKRTRELFVERKIVPTEEENKKHIQNTELLYPSRVNWTLKKTEARTEYDIKLQELANLKRRKNDESTEKLQAQVDKLRERLHEIEENQRLYSVKPGLTSDNVFHSLAERNSMLNASNEQLMAKRRNLEEAAGGIDPFARFDTTGQSYFSIRRKGEKDDGPKPAIRQAKEGDWRECLKTWGTGKKRKISENPLDLRYDIELEGLDDFQKYFTEKDHNGTDAVSRAPCVDAAYEESVRRRTALPVGAKAISFEEWSKLRMA